jgi:Holliday junction resolvase
MSSRSKQKGDRAEYKIRDRFNEMGLDCSRVPLSGALGGQYSGDLHIRGLFERTLTAEVKCRKKSNVFWKTVQKFLGENDALFLIEDRKEPLVVMEFKLLQEVMKYPSLSVLVERHRADGVSDEQN